MTTTCQAPGCDRKPVAKGLCMRHYKRQRNGLPLTPQRAVGSPDGHGRYGVLEDDGERVLCHECGRWFRSLSSHVHTHDMTARQYKLEHGLPLTRGISSTAAKQRRSEIARERTKTAGWKRLEEARNPTAASHARDSETWQAMSAARQRDPDTSTRNLPKRVVRISTCPVCGAQWCTMPGSHPRATCSQDCARELTRRASTRQARAVQDALADRDAQIVQALRDGASRQDVAARFGLTPERVGQIARRDL